MLVISDDNPVPEVVPSLEMYSTRTVYGKLFRVGGERKIQIELEVHRGGNHGQKISADVTVEMAKELGNRMFNVIGVSGTAKIDFKTKDILSFVVTRILDYGGNDSNPTASLLKAESLSPGAWSGIDSDAYQSDLREWD